MKNLLYLGCFALLSLLKCAEVASSKKPAYPTASYDAIPRELICMIAFYLKNPLYNLGSLNKFSKDALSTFPVKPILKRFLDIPELLTDDVADNEEELKLLLPLAKFLNPVHFCRALQCEFLNTNRFTKLLPHLLNYFDRIDPKRYSLDEVSTLLKNKKAFVLFENDAALFYENANQILFNEDSVKDLQQYILENPEHLPHVDNYFKSINYFTTCHDKTIENWYQFAFALNMPKEFLFGFPNYSIKVFTSSFFLWTEACVPSHLYEELYGKCKVAFARNYFYEAEGELYELLNSIRFGPDNPELNDEQFELIQSKYTRRNVEEITLLIRCVSLSNKMDLFAKMMGAYKNLILNSPVLTEKDFNRNIPLGAHKFMFDIHAALNFKERQFLYSSPHFFILLSINYRIQAVEWNKEESTMRIEFKAKQIAQGVPEILITDQIITDEIISKKSSKQCLAESLAVLLLNYQFESTAVVVGFIEKFYAEYSELVSEIQIPINGYNLKLIASSESALEVLKTIREVYSIENQLFAVKLQELLEVVDEPVPCLVDIVELEGAYFPTKKLADFNSPEKIERLEILLGHPVISLLRQDIEYFEYRYILKHFVKKGYKIPKFSRQETLDLLKIDFPDMNL